MNRENRSTALTIVSVCDTTWGSERSNCSRARGVYVEFSDIDRRGYVIRRNGNRRHHSVASGFRLFLLNATVGREKAELVFLNELESGQ